MSGAYELDHMTAHMTIHMTAHMTIHMTVHMTFNIKRGRGNLNLLKLRPA